MSEKVDAKSLTPLEVVWLVGQFDQLHREHALILSRLDDLSKVVPAFVSPDLQAAIITNAKLVLGIDLKVPDVSPQT